MTSIYTGTANSKTYLVSICKKDDVTRNWIRSGASAGVVVSSDGEVTAIGTPNTRQHVRVNNAIAKKDGSYEGNTYKLGSIAGENVNLRLEGPHSTLTQVGSGITADEAKI